MVHLVGPISGVARAAAQFQRRWDFVDAPGGLDVDVADTAVAALRFAAGPVGVVTTAWAGASAPGFHLELSGNRGRLILRAPAMPDADTAISLGLAGGALEHLTVPDRLGSTDGIDLEPVWPGDPGPAMARSFWLMTRAIRGVGEARPDFARGHHVQSVIEAIHRSGDGDGLVQP